MTAFSTPSNTRERIAFWILVFAAVAVPIGLAWDFSWESTIGVDRVWAPPHLATYVAIALAALAALALFSLRTEAGLRFGKWHLPLGAGVSLWGALAFAVGVCFDRWWQSAYGLAAGIWHPPQILNATAFLAVIAGGCLCAVRAQRAGGSGLALLFTGGALLAMFTVFSMPAIYANRQHSAPFHLLACGTYPVVLTALAVAGKPRFSATLGALIYMGLLAALVWVLPLVPGAPAVAPIYHPRTTLLPPPFPLLLGLPALAIDLLLRISPGRRAGLGAALETGLAFFLVFGATQWFFSAFLLSPTADHWFFAGGGRQWPFFLRISSTAQTTFWNMPGQEMTLLRGLAAALLAVTAVWVGLVIGTRLQRLQR